MSAMPHLLPNIPCPQLVEALDTGFVAASAGHWAVLWAPRPKNAAVIPTYLDLECDPVVPQLRAWLAAGAPRDDSVPVYPARGVVDPRPTEAVPEALADIAPDVWPLFTAAGLAREHLEGGMADITERGNSGRYFSVGLVFQSFSGTGPSPAPGREAVLGSLRRTSAQRGGDARGRAPAAVAAGIGGVAVADVRRDRGLSRLEGCARGRGACQCVDHGPAVAPEAGQGRVVPPAVAGAAVAACRVPRAENNWVCRSLGLWLGKIDAES
jgi:hypothetical protein